MSILDHVWGESPAADRVWALVCGISPGQAHREVMMIFQAYVDDSAKGDDFVLAGHVASAETWARFSREWEGLLPLCKLRSDNKRAFKMSEIPITEDGIWIVRTFYKLIEKYEIVSIASCLKKSVLSDVQQNIYVPNISMNLRQLTRNWGRMDNVFIVLFRLILEGMNENRQILEPIIPQDATIDVIFDETAERNIILSGWDRYVQNRPQHLRKLFGATPRFEKDEKFLPLQAADMWAWWTRESTFRPPRSSEESLLIDSFINEIKESKRKTLYIVMDRNSTQETMMTIARNDFWRSISYNLTYDFTSKSAQSV